MNPIVIGDFDLLVGIIIRFLIATAVYFGTNKYAFRDGDEQ